MAEDDAEWNKLLKEAMAAPPTVDAGPEARRARAGLPPGPRMTDPDAPTGPVTVPSATRQNLDAAAALAGGAGNSFIDRASLGGYGALLRAADALGEPTGVARSTLEAMDRYRSAHPIASQITDAPAYFMPGAAPARLTTAIGRGAERAFATPALQTIATGVGAGGLISGLGAASEGAGPGETIEATGQGAALGGAVSAAGAGISAGLGRLARGAPDRVAARAVRETVTGEGGESARGKTAARVVERAGDELGNVKQLLADQPQLEKMLATKAATDPVKAGAAVDTAIGKVSAESGPMLDAITEKTGGVRVLDVNARLDQLRRGFLKAGKMDAATAVGKAQDQLRANYGTEDAFGARTFAGDSRLDARAMQNMKNTIGNVVFDQQTAPSTRREAGRAIWGVLSGALEEEGARAGVNVEKLRRLNQNMSVLIPMRDALAERTARIAGGKPTLADRARQFSHVAIPASAAIAGASHGGAAGALEGLVAGYAVPKAIEAGASGTAALARRFDYALAQRARAGAEPVGPRLAPALSQALEAKDHNAAAAATAQEIFGQ